mgnify:FL=1
MSVTAELSTRQPVGTYILLFRSMTPMVILHFGKESVTLFPMSLLHIEKIRESVRNHAPERREIKASTRRAAVALILRPIENDTEALFILRAVKEGDPWSGHMAFPGGHQDDTDSSLRAAAERETIEEIGLDLVESASYIGEIDWVQANPHGRNLDMVVAPFVYELNRSVDHFNPNYEVADVLWGSLSDMHAGTSHTMHDFGVGGETMEFPGYGVGDEIVWGLTYRMLELFFMVLDSEWQGHE